MGMTEIKAANQLDDIVYRLGGCRALLQALCVNAETSATSANALESLGELLNYIIQDLQAAVSAAGDYSGKGGQTGRSDTQIHCSQV